MFSTLLSLIAIPARARGLAVAILVLWPSVASADEAANMNEARAALATFMSAIASGERASLEAVLAPEYQIMRSNGVGFDRTGYVEKGAPSVKVLSPSRPEDIVVTRNGDIMVARYFLVVDQTIAGERTERRAPRLTVFRRHGDRWIVTAHSNFGNSK
jgi:hypothetical protein